MKYAELANAGVHEQPVYEPGKPIEYVAREFGPDPTQIAKLASNENPFGASPVAMAAAQASLKNAHLYPDGACGQLRAAIAEVRGVDEDTIIVVTAQTRSSNCWGTPFCAPDWEKW